MEAQPGVILLVDDDSDDVYLTRHAFAGSDIATEIVVARDGVEALQLLLPQDGVTPLRPVIVLLDIHPPRMGGLQLRRPRGRVGGPPCRAALRSFS